MSGAHIESVSRGAVACGIVVACERVAVHDRASVVHHGPGRDEARPLERVSAAVANVVAAIARVVGADRFAGSVHSLTGAELAEGSLGTRSMRRRKMRRSGAEELHASHKALTRVASEDRVRLRSAA